MSNGSILDVTAYTDNQSLHNAHNMKQTLQKKRLLVDISSIREIIEQNKIQVTWINKEKQLSGNLLTKAGASSKNLLNVLSTSKMIDL